MESKGMTSGDSRNQEAKLDEVKNFMKEEVEGEKRDKQMKN